MQQSSGFPEGERNRMRDEIEFETPTAPQYGVRGVFRFPPPTGVGAEKGEETA